MPPEKGLTGKLSVEEAIQRIQNMCINNAERLSKLEEKYDQICKSITQKHEEIEAQITNIQSQTNEMHMKTTLTLDEDKQQFDIIRQQCHKIVGTLYSLANVEQSELQSIQKFPKSANDYLTSTQPVFNIDDHSNCTNKTMPPLPENDVKLSKSHTIVIPSPTGNTNFLWEIFRKSQSIPNLYSRIGLKQFTDGIDPLYSLAFLSFYKILR